MQTIKSIIPSMTERFERKEAGNADNSTIIYALEEDQPLLGYLEYFWDPERSMWALWDLASHKKGMGKKLVREFVLAIGSYQPIVSPITEDDTRNKLADLGFFDQAMKAGQITLSGGNLPLQDLKMARVFSGGGINIEQIIIKHEKDLNWDENPFEDQYPVSVTLYGTTK